MFGKAPALAPNDEFKRTVQGMASQSGGPRVRPLNTALGRSHFSFADVTELVDVSQQRSRQSNLSGTGSIPVVGARSNGLVGFGSVSASRVFRVAV